MMLTHAGPQSPHGASPFACPGFCRQSCAHVAQVLSIRGLSLASRADSCLEHGQHRLPAAYQTWDGPLPRCRGTFLPLASPCLAGVFLGWLFSFYRCPGGGAFGTPQAACNKSAQEINSSLVHHQHQLWSLYHRALGLPCSKCSWEAP